MKWKRNRKHLPDITDRRQVFLPAVCMPLRTVSHLLHWKKKKKRNITILLYFSEGNNNISSTVFHVNNQHWQPLPLAVGQITLHFGFYFRRPKIVETQFRVAV